MKYLLSIAMLSFMACHPASTQSIEQTSFALKSNPRASCIWLTPKSGKVKGLLVLIAGFGQTATATLPETRIPETEGARDVLTVVLGLGPCMYADSLVTATIDELIGAAQARYRLGQDRLVLGGFSIGGAIALRYAEYCNEQTGRHPMLPKAVFAVDAPVDLIELWHYFERELTRNADADGVAEAQYVSALLKREIGTPSDNRARYEALTPYCHSCPSPGQERFLKNTAVRVYHDIDVNWYLKNKKRSAYDCNFLNASEMIGRLMQLGNEQAAFVQGKTGYRSNGKRHPHAWSIVDEQELAGWIDTFLP